MRMRIQKHTMRARMIQWRILSRSKEITKLHILADLGTTELSNCRRIRDEYRNRDLSFYPDFAISDYMEHVISRNETRLHIWHYYTIQNFPCASYILNFWLRLHIHCKTLTLHLCFYVNVNQYHNKNAAIKTFDAYPMLCLTKWVHRHPRSVTLIYTTTIVSNICSSISQDWDTKVFRHILFIKVKIWAFKRL